MYNFLQKQDPKIYQIIQHELERQRSGLEMIASENFTSLAVMQTMSSVLTNKYAEGYPGKRYYGGNEFIDQAEQLAIDRAKELFKAEHANVQPHSGSQANMAAYLALLNPGDKILAMDLSAGGHLTHGAKFNFSGKFYQTIFYGVDPQTEMIDMNQVEKIALKEKPRLIIAGASAYPRIIDFKTFSKIAQKINAYFMVDMAHIAGLVATGLHPDPIPYADIVTTTTHKTLRGPRGALILSKNNDRLKDIYYTDSKRNLAQRVDSGVFPGSQGGPLEHIIAAKAVAFGEALKPEFKKYQKQVVTNAKILAETLQAGGLRIVSGGTDNHLMLVDLTPVKLGGQQVEEELEKVGIYINKNMIPFDQNPPTNPSGIRIGTPALTTRGFKENDIQQVGELILKVVKNIDNQTIKDEVKKQVQELVQRFPLYEDIKM
ncbi:MAG: serine hydroxymethyltransferase [Patescibacteria group bacterium]|nr:serine hydroxymethyltransferase [Patescibacteria group bacterium]